MTPREMEDKLRQYEYAMQDIINAIWNHAVKEQDRRHAAGELDDPQQQSFGLGLLRIAFEALQQPPMRLM